MYFDDSTDKANAVVNRWIVKQYRDDGGENAHLRDCPDLQLVEVEGYNGTYGCDTGCEYARLTAVAKCPHGETEDFEYGELGDLNGILEQILRDED